MWACMSVGSWALYGRLTGVLGVSSPFFFACGTFGSCPHVYLAFYGVLHFCQLASSGCSVAL